MNEKVRISIDVWLNFVPKRSINCIGSDSGLAAYIKSNVDPIQWPIYTALGGDGLKFKWKLLFKSYLFNKLMILSEI